MEKLVDDIINIFSTTAQIDTSYWAHGEYHMRYSQDLVAIKKRLTKLLSTEQGVKADANTAAECYVCGSTNIGVYCKDCGV